MTGENRQLLIHQPASEVNLTGAETLEMPENGNKLSKGESIENENNGMSSKRLFGGASSMKPNIPRHDDSQILNTDDRGGNHSALAHKKSFSHH